MTAKSEWDVFSVHAKLSLTTQIYLFPDLDNESQTPSLSQKGQHVFQMNLVPSFKTVKNKSFCNKDLIYHLTLVGAPDWLGQ